jgi:heat shock protein HslJ
MHMYLKNAYSLFGTLFAGLILLLTAACAPAAGMTATPETQPTPEPPTQLEGTEWVLVRYGPTAAPVEPLADNAPTLSFDNGNLGGNTGCNHYGGDYRIEGDRLIIDELFQTLIGCPEPVMAQEEAYLDALRAADTFTLTGDSLTLFYEGGELFFARHQPPADETLERTEWQLTTFVSGETARSLLAGTEITAIFQGGTVNGNAGCNDYHAAYVLAGNELAIGDTAATRIYCDGIMDQENEFLRTLRSVQSFEIDGRQLSLHHGDGSLIFNSR